MTGVNTVRIEPLGRENFDTWKIQMQALLVKTDGWQYVSGGTVKPALIGSDANSIATVKAWESNDEKAKSDIILSISPSELKQIKGYNTSKEVWDRLHSIYQSKGPARIAMLLKNLMLRRMKEGEDLKDHLRKFFDTVDKLMEMDVEINKHLLSVMLLYSLPKTFENFRCAIESRDDLPTAEILPVKIIEEYDSRKNDSSDKSTNAFVIKRDADKKKFFKDKNVKKEFKFRCYRCQKIGHKANNCRSRMNEFEKESAKKCDTVSFCTELESIDVCKESVNLGTEFTVVHEENASFGTNDMSWCLDSGCTAHLCKDKSKFVNGISETKGQQSNLASNASTSIVGKGNALMITKIEDKLKKVNIANALYVPDLRMNLMSVGKITDNGFTVVFTNKKADIIDNCNKDVTLTAHRINGLYCINELSCRNDIEKISSAIASVENYAMIWHRRMGHLNFRDLFQCDQNGCVRGMNLKGSITNLDCDTCNRAKMTRSSFPKRLERSERPLQIVHTDLCGPMRVSSNGGALYFITFIDDYSRWCEIYFLKRKDEVLETFKKYKQFVERKSGFLIQALQSDNGGEYINKSFNTFLEQFGIQRRLTTPHTPEQNGVAERRNRTTVEMARCMLIGSKLATSFWAEAVNTANYVRNRCPSKTLNGKTPYELWIKRIPNVSYFKVFGCDVYVLDKSPKGKFEARSNLGFFVGYSNENKGFRVWIPEEKKVIIARDIKFIETRILPDNRGISSEDLERNKYEYVSSSEDHSRQKSLSDPKSTEIIDKNKPEKIIWEFDDSDRPVNEVVEEVVEDVTEKEVVENVNENNNVIDNDINIVDSNKRGPGRPRLIRTGHRGRPAKEYHTVNSNDEYDVCHVFQAEVFAESVLHGPDSDDWYRAMSEEMRSILKKDTWSIVDRPRERNIVGSRCVLRNKYSESSKARRVLDQVGKVGSYPNVPSTALP